MGHRSQRQEWLNTRNVTIFTNTCRLSEFKITLSFNHLTFSVYKYIVDRATFDL